MALPHSKNARLFYRAALQRYEDSVILRDANRFTGAVYLAGYSVECMLKALVLNGIPESKHPEIVSGFRGRAGHDLERLKELYAAGGGTRIPAEITRALVKVNVWGVDLRYSPATINPKDSQAFLVAAKLIIDWANGRI